MRVPGRLEQEPVGGPVMRRPGLPRWHREDRAICGFYVAATLAVSGRRGMMVTLRPPRPGSRPTAGSPLSPWPLALAALCHRGIQCGPTGRLLQGAVQRSTTALIENADERRDHG